MSVKMRKIGFLKHSGVLAGLSLLALYAPDAHALDPFTDGSDLLVNADLSSGVAIGVADMNADGLDDIVRLDNTQFLEIEYQQEDGSFTRVEGGSTGTASWSIAIADYDGNGYNDIFTGGAYDDLALLVAADDGSGFTKTSLSGPGGTFVQCSSFSDIDNDGNLDLFVCHDDGKSRPFRNMGDGSMQWTTTDFIDPESTVASDDSGNYGNVWTDYDGDGDADLYIAKCRQGVNNPNDGRRLNLLFENDGNGNYTDVAESVGLMPRGQSWSADFADIDNDGDMDAFVLNHGYAQNDVPSELYENDGGSFTEITAAAGIVSDLDDVGTGIQNYFGDFDNDGFVDLIVTSGAGEHRFFANNGDNTFTHDPNALPTGNLDMQSLAVGDLNNDGSLDIVGGFANGFNQPTNNSDRLYLNSGNDNNWFKIRLVGTMSNRSAVGAIVKITGAWGTQVREVRAGESYGISHSLTRHFGLGTADEIETLEITWPSGTVNTIKNPEINQTVEVTEGCPTEFFADTDGDGFGDADSVEVGCVAPRGYVEDNTDCDDDDENNYPGNEEVCDGADNNCDGDADEGLGDKCDPPGGSSSGGEDDSSGGVDPTTPGTSGPVDPTNGSDPTATGGGSDDESSGGGGGQDGGGGGCAVSSPSQDAFFFLMLFGFAVPVVRRRSKR